MALTNGPKLGLLVDGEQGEVHYEALMRRWRMLDSLVQASAISATLTTPPASPADGATYIVPTGATGDWSGQATHIARWSAKSPAAWDFVTPLEGWWVWVNSANDFFHFRTGTGWTAWRNTIDRPYDLAATYPGAPAASALMLRIPLARAVVFPAGLTGSRGTATANATGTTVFNIQLNGATVGTMTFAAGASTATFTAASAIGAVAGDVISVLAPATPDATLTDVGFVLSGTR
jgi:hypothetical protein